MTFGGVVFGLLSGIVTAWMLVKLLTGVFDPSPETLSVPWVYLGTVLCLAAGSVAAAVLLARPRQVMMPNICEISEDLSLLSQQMVRRLHIGLLAASTQAYLFV